MSHVSYMYVYVCATRSWRLRISPSEQGYFSRKEWMQGVEVFFFVCFIFSSWFGNSLSAKMAFCFFHEWMPRGESLWVWCVLFVHSETCDVVCVNVYDDGGMLLMCFDVFCLSILKQNWVCWFMPIYCIQVCCILEVSVFMCVWLVEAEIEFKVYVHLWCVLEVIVSMCYVGRSWNRIQGVCSCRYVVYLVYYILMIGYGFRVFCFLAVCTPGWVMSPIVWVMSPRYMRHVSYSVSHVS